MKRDRLGIAFYGDVACYSAIPHVIMALKELQYPVSAYASDMFAEYFFMKEATLFTDSNTSAKIYLHKHVKTPLKSNALRYMKSYLIFRLLPRIARLRASEQDLRFLLNTADVDKSICFHFICGEKNKITFKKHNPHNCCVEIVLTQNQSYKKQIKHCFSSVLMSLLDFLYFYHHV